MREIKFRAWHKNTKVMYSAEQMGKDQLTISTDGKGFINVHGDDTSKSEYMNHLIPMQYTGLKDKNGKDIYEGDIVNLRDTAIPKDLSPMIVVWGHMGWVLKEISYHGYLRNFDKSLKFFEVIGNVHMNPELLK